jgi:hypothetical protein
MKNLVLLLVLLICVLAYVRAQQPATWNSWMAATGTNGVANPATPTDSDTPVAPTAAAQPAPRIAPVGGLIKNGNFVAGEGPWQGDGTADPSGKGIVVTLNPSSWTRVYQTFADQGNQHSIEITYKLSTGLTVSRNPADYSNISKSLQISGYENFHAMVGSPGQFYGTVGDPTQSISEEVYNPQLGSTDIQDYQHDYPSIPASGTKIFALAFPPGTGTVTLLTAYVTSR